MKLGVVMDPIETINFKKDSTLAMMIEAQNKGHEIFYMTPDSLFINSGVAFSNMANIEVRNDSSNWFSLGETSPMNLSHLDAILMRQDPPFNSEYIYNTYVLEMASRLGVHVFNNPRSLRDCNEKVFATEFPQCCTKHLVTNNKKLLKDFVKEKLTRLLKLAIPANDKFNHWRPPARRPIRPTARSTCCHRKVARRKKGGSLDTSTRPSPNRI